MFSLSGPPTHLISPLVCAVSRTVAEATKPEAGASDQPVWNLARILSLVLQPGSQAGSQLLPLPTYPRLS